jgi:Transglycosylase-like domain
VNQASKPLCGRPTCTTSQLRARVVEIRRQVVRLRDRRGLLGLRLRDVRLTDSPAQLTREGMYWRARWHRIHDARPLWRTLKRWDDWMCIHGHEGAWTDPNGPYHGGLQMDAGFMRAYGGDLLERYGTADHWPAAAQVAVAERAYKARGFHPWPNTARACGLA